MASKAAEADQLRSRFQQERERTGYSTHLPPIPPVPAKRYSDPRFFDLEIEHVFKKTWLSIGHVSQLPEIGSYFLFERLGQSIIISRGTDDVIRAFKNTCRHRGSALLTQPTGTARRFVCPYHAWGYASDGTLRSIPEEQNFCLDKADLPLFRVRCEVWRGFILINLDNSPDSMSMQEFMAPMDAVVGDFPFEDMAVKGVIDFEFDCNWKTGWDNFLEAYHVNTVHSTTIAPFLEPKTFHVERHDHGHASMHMAKRDSAATLFGTDNVGQPQGVANISERYRVSAVTIPRFPNASAGLDPAGFVWQTVWPVSPDKVISSHAIMGRTLDDPEEDRKYYENLLEFNRKVINEDRYLFASIQRSLREGDLDAIVLGSQEEYIQWYHEHLDRKIGVEKIPPELRIDQVLTRYDEEQRCVQTEVRLV
jgi:phenylpropionate dioxygenase-like ring-hydroxylating dioxygenase large terminal subunit